MDWELNQYETRVFFKDKSYQPSKIPPKEGNTETVVNDYSTVDIN